MLDKCPVSTYKDIAEVIEQDLGKKPEELFASIEEVPIASASLAQVSLQCAFNLVRQCNVHKSQLEFITLQSFELMTSVDFPSADS